MKTTAIKAAISSCRRKAMVYLVGLYMLVFSAIGGLPSRLWGAPSATLIYDLEIQDYLEELQKPIWKAAGLEEKNLRIYIIRDPSVNAFVMTGQNIFVFTGLLTYVKNSEELRGVLAHETGHIVAGDSVYGPKVYKQSIFMILGSMALGVAAIAVGAGGAGMAILAAGVTAGADRALVYSRTQEAAADQAAVTFLNRAQLSSRGMLSIFERFSKEEDALGRIDPFRLSHPLSSQRLKNLAFRVKNSPYYAAESSPQLDERLRFIQAKIRGFTDNPNVLYQRLTKNGRPASSLTSPELYTLAIAQQRLGDPDEAIKTLELMLKRKPNNPYVLETKAQFLLEKGSYQAAFDTLTKAAAHHRPSSELFIQQAECLLQMEDEKQAAKAITLLEKARVLAPDNPLVFYQLSIAYGQKKEIGPAELALAQRDLILGNWGTAKDHALRAQSHLSRGSPAWLRSEDILMQAEAGSRGEI